jgi:hypothetical protein
LLQRCGLYAGGLSGGGPLLIAGVGDRCRPIWRLPRSVGWMFAAQAVVRGWCCVKGQMAK